MCGIYGIIPLKKKKDTFTLERTSKDIEILFHNSLSRGSEAAGLTVVSESKIKIIKKNNDCRSFLKSKEYEKIKNDLQNKELTLLFGQTRMATNGSALFQENNQPTVSENNLLVGIHNGIITNHEQLQKKPSEISESDTQNLLNYLESVLFSSNIDLPTNFEEAISKIEGTANLALFLPTLNKFILYSNHGSLYYLIKENSYYFASEYKTLELVDKNLKIKQIKNKAIVLELKSKKSEKYTFELKNYQSNENNNLLTKELNSLERLQSHTINQQKINSIPRCSECILPNTTPFISFNENGVCNYCLEHQKIKYKGKNSLEKILNKYRRKDGKPDCLLAFSGGRDSSYGLHLLKKELGMNPLAFTYDWGMISDLGRRNQARMLSKLETEYILISADIAKKRKHIRQNILAWIKRPNLGMVPIFMQGDKQCEYYADKVMKKYNIPLMIYCRGNELEKEEFKAGYCGIKEADPGGVIHNLSVNDKAKLLKYYAKEYLLNPAYINESIFDTALGYFSTYLKSHDYLYLWHYLPWNEKEINNTLNKKYNWEMSDDTPTSWRIGDGTPAFYNYIYYQVQGFTENDSLRARQVREGLLTRKEALKLVATENKPQYKNLKWYFDTLDLDGDMILSVIDKMVKKYTT